MDILEVRAQDTTISKPETRVQVITVTKLELKAQEITMAIPEAKVQDPIIAKSRVKVQYITIAIPEVKVQLTAIGETEAGVRELGPKVQDHTIFKLEVKAPNMTVIKIEEVIVTPDLAITSLVIMLRLQLKP